MGLVCSVRLLYGRALCAVVGVVSSPGQSAEASAPSSSTKKGQ